MRKHPIDAPPGSLSEQMQDYDGAMQCYEQALKFNQWSVPAMQGIACILRTKDAFPAAVEYLRTILKVDQANGDVWGSLGKKFARIFRESSH